MMGSLIHRIVLIACVAGLLLLVGIGYTADNEPFRRASPEYGWSFPRDHGSHPEYRTEWWYFTGWLDSKQRSEPMGFQFTIFRQATAGQSPASDSPWATRQILYGHRAISLPGPREHHQRYVISRAHPRLAYADTTVPGTIRLRSWSLEIRDQWKIRVRGHNSRIQLTLQPTRPPLFHGEQGYSRKGHEPGNASHYYSFTRMKTNGRIVLRGDSILVEGITWFDHEFGTSQLGKGQVGWDWLSLRLSNGADLMVYRLRERDGDVAPQSRLTYRDRNGRTRSLTPDRWTMKPGSTWTSPRTEARYPVRWRLTVPSLSLRLDINALFNRQEMHPEGSRAFTYWEGMIRAQGTIGEEDLRGNGYMELTGYAGSLEGRF